MRLRGVLSGSLALIALQVIVTSKQTGRVASLFALPAGAARWLIDPTINAVPKLAAAAATNTTAQTTAAATTTPGTVDWSTVVI